MMHVRIAGSTREDLIPDDKHGGGGVGHGNGLVLIASCQGYRPHIMRFQTDLVPATLIRRYKRFLADIRLEGGREVTAHCANPGAMTGLAEPGARIWVEPNDDPKKKLKYGWRLVDHGNGHFTGVDTSLPNRALRAALEAGEVAALAGYDRLRAEVAYGTGSRIDFLLEGAGRRPAYVEVKSVTLQRHPGIAEFPDSVTARGTKYLAELAQMARDGHRAVMFYLVQRSDARAFRLASDIDPAYAAGFDAARAAGVEVLIYDTRITPEAVTLGRALALG